MCTAVILRRPGHPWPVLFAANRDEMLDRPWRPPARHWPERPGVVAGLDAEGGGTWLGLNDDGVLAGALNRVGSLGPAKGKRSRGELVLEALDHGDAATATSHLARLDPAAYRSFNLVIADRRDAYWLRNLGDDRSERRARARIEAFALPPGLSMITAHDRNDPESARIRAFLPRFRAAAAPEPEAARWGGWTRLLRARGAVATDGEEAAMSIVTDWGFGTSSSSLLALPGPPRSLRGRADRPLWLFAAGPPHETRYRKVRL